jgi:hypothetical protein
MVMLPSSIEATVDGLTCPGKNGRTRQYTLILPIQTRITKSKRKNIKLRLNMVYTM